MHAFTKHLYFAVHNVHSLSCTVCMHVLLLGWITCRWGKACVWPHKWYVICACMHTLYISATLQPLLYRVCTIHSWMVHLLKRFMKWYSSLQNDCHDCHWTHDSPLNLGLTYSLCSLFTRRVPVETTPHKPPLDILTVSAWHLLNGICLAC